MQQVKLSFAEQVGKVAVTPDEATRRPGPPSEYSLATELSGLAPGWIPSFKDLEGDIGIRGELPNKLSCINSGSSRISFRQRIVPRDAQRTVVHWPLCLLLFLNEFLSSFYR